MNYNPRIIIIQDSKEAQTELLKLDCDPVGVTLMTSKMVFKTLKLESIPAKAANLLKQTFLAKGGEVAIARGCADLSVETTDVIIFATLKQYHLALDQLKMQPWGLPKVAASIESAIAAFDSFPCREYTWPRHKLSITPGHSLIMGILNITPDSFSDGGKFNTLDSALRHAENLIADGADIIDIGAESTRPYGDAKKITAEEELDRLMPVLERILDMTPIPVSIDTYKADVAEQALKLGAHMINDVWGLQFDPDMAETIAKFNVPVTIMHNQNGTDYSGDIMSHICNFLQRSIDIAAKAGINRSNLIVDAGIGFGKTPAHNLVVMSQLEELKTLGCPILLGTSRKRFIGEALGGLPADDRLEGTAATITLGIMKGANIMRVHDVKEMKRVARMTDAMMRGEM